MKKNEIMSPDEAAKNSNDLTNIVFAFFNEREIGYANGIALIGSVLANAFHEVCSQLKMSDEKSRKVFNELLDTMKLRLKLKEWPNDIIEEGDNETTDAN